MKSIIKFELYNCINSKLFKIILPFIMVLSIASILFNCYSHYKLDILFVRSAADSSIIVSVYGSLVYSAFILCLPLISSLIYSDSYSDNVEKNITQIIATRINRESYIIAKTMVISFVSFFIVAIPLLINFLLAFIAFPAFGKLSYYLTPPYDIAIQNYDANYWMDLLRVQNVNEYILVRILVVSLFSAMFALFSYSLYFIKGISEKNRYLPLGIVYGLYILNFIVTQLLENTTFSIFEYMDGGMGCSNMGFLTLILCLLVTSISIIYFFGIKKKERELL